ncbi:MAG TPA: hypothetical protein VK463_13030 [Desulfomonilaceae bacterium]|nr:hypothetical protein [Desulfomonilaceae bacterium]
MSDTDTKVRPEQNTFPHPAASGFERALSKAQDLIAASDLDGALDVLSVLEDRYIGYTKLFDLLGDVFLRKGNVEEGVRYKTLHEVLKGTFKIASEYGARRRQMQQTADTHEAAGVDEDFFAPEFPVTLAMAQEFMKQGHYERASDVFAKLSAIHPENKALQEAGQDARRKRGEKELMGVLQQWLGKIEQLKLDTSGGI